MLLWSSSSRQHPGLAGGRSELRARELRRMTGTSPCYPTRKPDAGLAEGRLRRSGLKYVATSVPFKWFNMLGKRVGLRPDSPGDLSVAVAGSPTPESCRLSNSRPIQTCIGCDLVEVRAVRDQVTHRTSRSLTVRGRDCRAIIPRGAGMGLRAARSGSFPIRRRRSAAWWRRARAL
jgi:hypothetical protein